MQLQLLGAADATLTTGAPVATRPRRPLQYVSLAVLNRTRDGTTKTLPACQRCPLILLRPPPPSPSFLLILDQPPPPPPPPPAPYLRPSLPFTRRRWHWSPSLRSSSIIDCGCDSPLARKQAHETAECKKP